jgi:hypothetical protein
MASNNPNLTVNDIIADVEARLASPNLNVSFYLPIVSGACQRVYQAITALGQEAKEKFFGANGTISLTQSTLEHDILTSIPDFGTFIDVEVLYGATGDTRNTATKLRTPAMWKDKSKVSTTYRPKESPLYYQSGNYIGVIPVAPEIGAAAYVRYITKLPQYTMGADVISIPYRFTWAIADYVQAKAIQRVNEDYSTSRQIEIDFTRNLEEITNRAADEINENDGTLAVEGSDLGSDPMN